MSPYVRGVMKGIHAPAGTVLGPNSLGELMVVVEDLPEGVAIGFATPAQIQEAIHRGEPCSLTEVVMRRRARKG